jgi:hypothetical protein
MVITIEIRKQAPQRANSLCIVGSCGARSIGPKAPSALYPNTRSPKP